MHIWQKSSTHIYSNNNRRSVAAVAAAAVLLALTFAAALRFGSTEIRLDQALRAMLQGNTKDPAYRILFYIRLPRACAAVITGAGLACAGVIIQAVLHNAMAAPNIIGVNSGAGLAAISVLALFPASADLVPAAAFCGAVAACMLIYAIASGTGAGRMTITLVGIAVSSMLNAGINTVKTICPDSIYDANAFMIGGIAGVTYDRIRLPGMLIAGGVALACVCARRLDVLTLGEDGAAGLGMNVRLNHLLLLILASVLAGSAVSVAGLLGFVGLVVPHIGRRLVGGRHRLLLPFSALGGGVLVLGCDVLGRVLAAPYELPVGILLSFVGGPFFIALILMQRKKIRYD